MNRRAKPEWVALYPIELLADLLTMPVDVRGAYATMICEIYKEGGSILNEGMYLAGLCGVSEIEWPKLWHKMHHKFHVKNGKITQKRCTIELAKARRVMQVHKDKGLKGAQVRWKKELHKDSPAMAQLSPSNAIISPSIVSLSSTKEIGVHKGEKGYGIEDVKDACVLKGIPESEAQSYFNHYDAQGFLRGNGQPITNLRSHIACVWDEKRRAWVWSKDAESKPVIGPDGLTPREAALKRHSEKTRDGL